MAAVLFPVVATAGMSRFFPAASAYGLQIDNNMMSALCVGCHTKTPRTGSDNSAAGSHFVFRDFSKPTGNRTWEKVTAWDNTTYSKYGKSVTENQPAGTSGEMICESCHNVLRNTGDKKLLASDNQVTDPNPLCEGCHTRASLPGHHPLTGESVISRGNLPLSTTAGTVYQTPLDNATYPGADRLNCLSCHKVHMARTSTGARILKSGIGGGVQGVSASGIDRQSDIDPAGTNRLVTDFTPLCASCHDK